MSQTLRKVIEAPGVLFGNTATGREWCVKALHPSDPITEIRGIPDHSAIPTVCMNYQSTFTLAVKGEDTWSYDVTILPHPLYFAYWSAPNQPVYCPESGQVTVGNFWNSQLVGGTGLPAHSLLYNAWLGIAQRWRMVYFGVTIYQDGPDLANQGTIVVSQAPLVPSYSNAVVSTAPLTVTRVAYFDQLAQGPNFQRSQAMPNAMMGRSRDGAYVPLKLTDTCQDWFSIGDSHGVIPAPLSGDPSSVFRPLGNTANFVYPFESVTATCLTNTNTPLGQVTPCLMSTNVAHVSARNLSPQTSYTFFFRVGIEMQLAASSSLTPQLKLSPPYDRQALDAYFVLSREMKDAYPADYNDLGKMWDVVSRAVRKMAPTLRTITGAAPFVDSAVAVTKLGDRIRAKRKGKRNTRKGRK